MWVSRVSLLHKSLTYLPSETAPSYKLHRILDKSLDEFRHFTSIHCIALSVTISPQLLRGLVAQAAVIGRRHSAAMACGAGLGRLGSVLAGADAR